MKKKSKLHTIQTNKPVDQIIKKRKTISRPTFEQNLRVSVRERELVGVPWPLDGSMGEPVWGWVAVLWLGEKDQGRGAKIARLAETKWEDLDGGGLESMRVREIETAVRSQAWGHREIVSMSDGEIARLSGAVVVRWQAWVAVRVRLWESDWVREREREASLRLRGWEWMRER